MAQNISLDSSLPLPLGTDGVAVLANPQGNNYMHQATSKNTRKAYQAAITRFERYGGQLPASEQMMADYLTQQATELNPRTLSLHLIALSHWHQYQSLSDPTQISWDPKTIERDLPGAW